MALPATDDFNRADQDLDASSDWTTVTRNPVIVSNRVRGNAGGVGLSKWVSDTANNDQYSECDFYTDGGAAAIGGPAIRVLTDDAYAFQLVGTSTTFRRTILIEASTRTTIATATTTTLVSGDLVRIEMTGTTLTTFLAGSSSGQPGGTDATISSGELGLFMYNGPNANAELDNWEGGNLGAGPAATFQPAWAMNSNVVIQ